MRDGVPTPVEVKSKFFPAISAVGDWRPDGSASAAAPPFPASFSDMLRPGRVLQNCEPLVSHRGRDGEGTGRAMLCCGCGCSSGWQRLRQRLRLRLQTSR